MEEASDDYRWWLDQPIESRCPPDKLELANALVKAGIATVEQGAALKTVFAGWEFERFQNMQKNNARARRDRQALPRWRKMLS